MTNDDKLAVTRQLIRLGIDIIKAGFPAFSPDDLDVVRSNVIEVENQPFSVDGHVSMICNLTWRGRRRGSGTHPVVAFCR